VVSRIKISDKINRKMNTEVRRNMFNNIITFVQMSIQCDTTSNNKVEMNVFLFGAAVHQSQYAAKLIIIQFLSVAFS